MANARDLIANYSTYTSARELNHSAAADNATRTSPACAASISAYSVVKTFDTSC